MRKNYLEYLKSKCESFFKDSSVFEIILYGSYTKGKIDFNDIDLLIIFQETNLKHRTNKAQELKNSIKENLKKPVDVKTINLKELFDKNFLPRKNVLIEGISLKDGIRLSKKLGFEGRVIFSYSLKNLTHNEKTKFSYSLNGRNTKGLLKKTESKKLGRGVISTPIENSYIIESLLNKYNIDFSKKNTLISL